MHQKRCSDSVYKSFRQMGSHILGGLISAENESPPFIFYRFVFGQIKKANALI